MRHGWLLTVAAALLLEGCAVAETVPVVTFDQAPTAAAPAGWKLRGTNGYASKMAVVETEVEGKPRRALRIDYNFTADRNPNGLNSAFLASPSSGQAPTSLGGSLGADSW